MTGVRGRSEVAFAAAVGLASVPLLLTSFSATFFPVQADETVLAWAAKQILLGRTPYVDFFLFLPPAVPYGLAGVFEVAGASLAVFRLVSILWLAIATSLFYLLLAAHGTGRVWAAGIALLMPALIVPFWPVPSHHWFAIGLGMAALLAVSGPDPGPRRFAAAGVLVGLAGLCVQTEGVLFGGLAALPLIRAERGRRAITAGALAAGVIAPLLACSAMLALNGGLSAAVDSVVLWPLRHYRESQPFVNPVGPGEAPGAAAATLGTRIDQGNALLAVLLAPLVVVLATRALVRARTAGFAARRDAGIVLAAAVMSLLVFSAGRAGWRHYVFIAPVLLVVLCWTVHRQSDRVGRSVAGAWLVAAALLLTMRWVTTWGTNPPSLAGVQAVDAAFRSTSLPAVVDELPDVRARGDAVLYLSHGGSSLYFYWAPDPPPVDWLLPPTFRANSEQEFAAIARFMDERAVPYVVMPESYAEAFRTQESALRTVLVSRYEPAGRTRWGVAFRRAAQDSRTSAHATDR